MKVRTKTEAPPVPALQQLDEKVAMTRLMFLEFLAGPAAGSVAKAAKMAGVDAWIPYRWAKKNEEFREAMAEARKTGDQVALDLLEEEADRRGVEGWEDPIYSGGGIAGTVRRYDGNLLMIRMKKLAPEYRDNHQLGTVQAGNVQIVVASFAGNGGQTTGEAIPERRAVGATGAALVIPGVTQSGDAVEQVTQSRKQRGDGGDGGDAVMRDRREARALGEASERFER